MSRWSGPTSPALAGWLRDVVTPIVGLWLIYQEAERLGEPRWPLLVIYAGMVGLPSVTFLDWRKTSAPAPLDPAGPSPPPPAPQLPSTPG